MWIIIFVILWIALVWFHKSPQALQDLKVKYWSILDILRQSGDPMWHPVLKPAIITGMYGKIDGVIGSNVNKGYEIYICLEGDDVNSATYVLLHELAHMTVDEYDHSNGFWENFKKIKELAVQHGLYTKLGEKNYCGDVVKD